MRVIKIAEKSASATGLGCSPGQDLLQPKPIKKGRPCQASYGRLNRTNASGSIADSGQASSQGPLDPHTCSKEKERDALEQVAVCHSVYRLEAI